MAATDPTRTYENSFNYLNWVISEKIYKKTTGKGTKRKWKCKNETETITDWDNMDKTKKEKYKLTPTIIKSIKKHIGLFDLDGIVSGPIDVDTLDKYAQQLHTKAIQKKKDNNIKSYKAKVQKIKDKDSKEYNFGNHDENKSDSDGIDDDFDKTIFEKNEIDDNNNDNLFCIPCIVCENMYDLSKKYKIAIFSEYGCCGCLICFKCIKENNSQCPICSLSNNDDSNIGVQSQAFEKYVDIPDTTKENTAHRMKLQGFKKIFSRDIPKKDIVYPQHPIYEPNNKSIIHFEEEHGPEPMSQSGSSYNNKNSNKNNNNDNGIELPPLSPLSDPAEPSGDQYIEYTMPSIPNPIPPSSPTTYDNMSSSPQPTSSQSASPQLSTSFKAAMEDVTKNAIWVCKKCGNKNYFNTHCSQCQ